MNHSDPIVRRFHACILASVPAILWGAPGTGKTARIASYAWARSAHYERWIISRCEPIDIKPRAMVASGVVVCEPPEMQRAREAAARGETSIVFFDEISRAERSTLGATLDIIDTPPPGVSVLAAANPAARGQAARHLESAAANRFCHLAVGVDAEAWATAQIHGWASDASDLPVPSEKDLDRATDRASAYVSAFIRANAALLEDEPGDPARAGKAWPSTRTWEYAKRLHAVAMALDLDGEDTAALVSGCVGDGASVAYLAFVLDADLPDPETLLAAPESYVPPDGRVDRVVVALTAVAGAIAREIDAKRWDAAWRLVGVVERAGQADAAVVASDLIASAFRKADPKAVAKLQPIANMLAKYAPRVAKILTGRS